MDMALGGIAVNKKLSFDMSDDDEEVNMSDNFSPCRTRSGIVYKPRTFSERRVQSSDSESDTADSVLESSEEEALSLDQLPFGHFDNGLSPIRKEKSRYFKSQISPLCFIKRRERTSTRVVPNPPKEKKSKINSTTKTANINPYDSPVLRRCSKRQHSSSSFSSTSSECDSDDSGRCSPLPEKKLRVSELSISRYEEEFLELSEVASGEFGSVKLARHRLDGSDYAVKVNKSKLRTGSYEEKKALNEVFAHATLNSNKHVVRYYNSWVEDGQVFIQNEFCQGGSLAEKIEEKRVSGQNFSEEELKKILRHTLKGLQYIHSKQLAHLDIKPENIFISIDQEISKKSDLSTDSEDESDDECNMMKRMDLKRDDQDDETIYKIGDLGHVASLYEGDMTPEEGDCRYMAPELLLMDINCSQLPKADIFSLGLSVYEAASLKNLPKNSFDDPEYETIRDGKLPYLDQYSRSFNILLSNMVNPDHALRPSSSKLVKNSFLNKRNSKLNLNREIQETKEKLQQLKELLGKEIL